MFEYIKEFLKEECIRCDNSKSCIECKTKMIRCIEKEDINALENCENIIKEAEKYMPHKLVIPAIYRHFKHKEDGIPNNYMYATMFVSEPEELPIRGDDQVIEVLNTETCYFQNWR